VSGIIGAIFLLAIILAIPDLAASYKDPSPISTSVKSGLGDQLGTLYLGVILAAVFVCTTAIQGATARLMFSMGRDRRMPLGSLWGRVHPTLHTPANAAVAVGVLAALPFVLTDSPIVLATFATGLIYFSYLLCNLGVLVARTRGWPHKGAWFKLGAWGTIINVLAILWGGVMTINFALWSDTRFFGNFGTTLRNSTNPSLTALTSGGKPISWLPDVPFFEGAVLLFFVLGVVYYLATGQGRKVDQVEADLATGEAVIG
jgi:amino acid transporter